MQSATIRINTAFFVTQKQITTHRIWYNRVVEKLKSIIQERCYSDIYDTIQTAFFNRYFSDCQNKFDNDKPAFLSLLETHIDIDEIIPISFRNHFYASTGRTRKYPLQALLWALIIQRIFSIPTDQLLLAFLAYSKPLRDFCGFTKIPDASKITHFKQDFLDDLQLVFDSLVDVTEPICQAIDSAKADMTIFDFSGIETFVTENNPKYANRIINQLKAFSKSQRFDKSYDPYKAAYGSMPSHSSVNPEIKQLYTNGHFCYVFKFGIVTNGLGIIRHISFYNKDFMISHPDIVVAKKSDSPDEYKCVHDSKLLIPTLKDFFLKHPLINPKNSLVMRLLILQNSTKNFLLVTLLVITDISSRRIFL